MNAVPSPLEFVRDDNKVYFVKYQEGQLWYRVESTGPKYTLIFPVPACATCANDDTGTGIFLPEDRALTYMRWIRKQLDTIKAGLAEAGVPAPDGDPQS